jgi:mono/diheme cytochrome c family protein
MSRVILTLLITVLVALAGFVGAAAYGADVQAGRRVAQSKCGQCHDADDWEGEGAASLESLIRDIVAGKVKHKAKFELTPAEVSDIAAYWAAGQK